jgi:hypothetical protein
VCVGGSGTGAVGVDSGGARPAGRWGSLSRRWVAPPVASGATAAGEPQGGGRQASGGPAGGRAGAGGAALTQRLAVQVVGGLVQHQQLRVVPHRGGQHQLDLLAACGRGGSRAGWARAAAQPRERAPSAPETCPPAALPGSGPGTQETAAGGVAALHSSPAAAAAAAAAVAAASPRRRQSAHLRGP